MSEIELQELCQQISQKFFNREFRHQIHYNSRLRSTGGRYLLQSGDIEINPKVEKQLGLEALIGVLKHELCHYHLHQQGLGYRHQDTDFKRLLHQVGGSRYVERMDTAKYLYQCTHCGLFIHRMRVLDTHKYRCGRCRGKITLVQAE